MTPGIMMEFLEFLKGMHPRFSYSEKTAEVWSEQLPEYSLDDLRVAAKMHVTQSHSQPGLHEILTFARYAKEARTRQTVNGTLPAAREYAKQALADWEHGVATLEDERGDRMVVAKVDRNDCWQVGSRLVAGIEIPVAKRKIDIILDYLTDEEYFRRLGKLYRNRSAYVRVRDEILDEILSNKHTLRPKATPEEIERERGRLAPMVKQLFGTLPTVPRVTISELEIKAARGELRRYSHV